MSNQTVFTYRRYIQGKITHSQYYGQFCSQRVIDFVECAIGKSRILNSNDPHFNDITLSSWDRLTYLKDIIDRDLLRSAENWKDPKTYPWSFCTQVCIAKEAARRIVKEHNDPTN